MADVRRLMEADVSEQMMVQKEESFMLVRIRLGRSLAAATSGFSHVLTMDMSVVFTRTVLQDTVRMTFLWTCLLMPHMASN